HHRCRHTILRRILNARERQRHDVSKIRKQVKRHHETTPKQQRSWQVLSRVAHFTRRESNVVPCRLREQWSNHRPAEHHHQREHEQTLTHGLKPHLRCRRLPTVLPGRPPR